MKLKKRLPVLLMLAAAAGCAALCQLLTGRYEWKGLKQDA